MAYGATIQVWPALVSLKTLIASVSGQILLKKDSTAEKTIFSFSKCSKEIVFPKKMEFVLSCIIRKDGISFSREYDLIL